MRAPIAPNRPSAALAAWAAVLVAVLAIAFAPVLLDLQGVWEGNAQYSHGYLVPIFAAVLLWTRRGSLRISQLRPSFWALPLLAAGLGLRHFASYVHVPWFEQFALVACLPGLVVAVGGREALRWSWPALAFLLFMLPLPYRLEVAMQQPLRKIGTLASTYVMQTAGIPAIAEGNVIAVNDVRIGVVEACSGLGMMMIFFALSTAVAIVSQRPVWERLFIVGSALPIAIVANAARITVTGVLHVLHFDSVAGVFHDRLAPLFMMPLALGLLWLETAFLSRLFVEDVNDPTLSPLATVAGLSPRSGGERRLAGTASR